MSYRNLNALPLSVATVVFFFFYSIILIQMLGPHPALFQDGDTLWHIRTGQWILDHGHVPVVDPYSFTAAGKRWITGQWLAEIIFSVAFELGSWRALVLLSAVTIGITLAILSYYLVQNIRFSVALGWTALTAVAISPHFLVRPHLFAFSLLLIWVIVLIDTYDSDGSEFYLPKLALALIIMLWANLHGSFTLGLAFLFIFTGFALWENVARRDFSRCRQLIFSTSVIALCALATPYGIFPVILPLELKLNYEYVFQIIQEWRTPDFQSYTVILLLFVSLFVLILSQNVRLNGPRLTLFALCLYLALSHARTLVVFFLVMPVIFARPLSTSSAWWRASIPDSGAKQFGTLDPILDRWSRRPMLMPIIFFAAAALTTAFCWQQINEGPSEDVAPKDAIDFVKSAGITGNVFNGYRFGGYLIFVGIPTFIDSRQPPYSDEFVRSFFNAVDLADITKAFELLRDYKITWIILNPKAPLAHALMQNTAWIKGYSDKSAVVFIRRTGSSR